MTFIIRIIRSAYEQAMDDLARPHIFAAERIGFMYGRVGYAEPSNALLHLTAYTPVRDEDYVQDRSVGARIGAAAIRTALERTIQTGEVTMHVHAHGHRGAPRFSKIDELELGRLIPSFSVTSPDVPHGGLVFSDDCARARVWGSRDARPRTAAIISVVGYPTTIWRSS